MTLPHKDRLLRLIGDFRGRKVLVWADLVVDRYILGHPKRVSREAPVLILKHAREWRVPGGGANTVMNLKALGGNPVPFGAVGEDGDGRYLLETFGNAGIPVGHVHVLKNYSTVAKVRILAGPESGVKQQVVRVDREDRLPDRARIRPAPLAGAAALVVSDYGYGSVRPELLAKWPSRIPVIVDSRFRLCEFRGAAVITPNEEEAASASGMDIRSDAEAAAAGRILLNLVGSCALLMTRGSRGVLLMEPRRAALPIPAHGRGEVADTTGAGDTVLAAFTLALASGASYHEAAVLANIAGALKVRKLGTATVSREELQHEIEDTYE